uniref:Uncharacterized protein n=1 Tax=Candidatus Kentrum sp. UNK TaxID=2126344 RepID=A0A451AHR5_9GAMM|nr:MAG: hypothetical protein BECKUNK1418G_GA0071005_106525 [Candidatus Kentron sp. UNK]VFK71531.1 MAG: hypothetical protein BECKUNK1418H_GA0071006_107025 [Candidatus Kentron sp. UNK]
MRFAYPPYAGTFFICWGDETLNMNVKLNSFLISNGLTILYDFVRFRIIRFAKCSLISPCLGTGSDAPDSVL